MAAKPPSRRVERPFRRVWWLFVLLPLCPPLFADQESGYYRVSTPDGIQFIQRLSWPENENASQYELEVERREAPDAAAGLQEYVEAYRIITTEAWAEFSLPPGDYRYRVIFYNLLRQPEYAAAWVEFTILLALQPELKDFTPRNFAAKRGDALELVIEGSNLLPGAEIRLDRRGRSFLPQDCRLEPSGEQAVLFYDVPDLPPGSYTITVQNPGGLEASLPGFWVESSAFFQVLLAYAPILPAGGYTFELFDDNAFYPAGLELRADWFPLKASWGTLGLEAAFGWSYLEEQRDAAGLTAHFGELALNALYRRDLNGYLAVKVRAGGGFGGMVNLVFDYGDVQSSGYNTISPMADLGVSLEWSIYSSLYAELGADGFFVFSKDTPQNFYIRPFAGLGWRF
ncbi:MAG: porin family protein [Treponema sp.]|nr:porin family protein [Treponema sp.]